MRRRVVGYNSAEAHNAFSRLVRDCKITASGLKQAMAQLEVRKVPWVEVLPSEKLLALKGDDLSVLPDTQRLVINAHFAPKS